MFMKVMHALNVIQLVKTNNYIDMKNRFAFIIFIGLLCLKTFGQETNGILKGKVTFVTATNVYVRFENTENIKVGDSLQIFGSKKACLSVTNKSSKSVVCIIINDCEVKKDDAVLFNYAIKQAIPIVEKPKVDSVITKPKVVLNKKTEENKNLEYVTGKLELATYSSFYNNRANRQRVISRFTLNAYHIKNSKFSFETYLNYRKETHSSSYNPGPFKVYDFALTYDATPTLSVVLGRKINNHTSSLGAIDGLQIEKHFGKNYVGVITGFRPDINDYGFNSNLFQYGAYLGRETNLPNFISQTTFGVIEQQNNGKIDRQYAYFQNSSTISNNLNLFSTFELDLFNKFNGISGNSRLTNFYVSARYRFNRKIHATVSYDSRKRIIYYETFQSDIERLLSDDVSRQGLRFRINAKPFKYVNVGASYSIRYQSNGLNKSENINGFVSMYQIPHFKGSLSLNYNRNISNYLESNIVSLSHSRTIFKDKWSTNLYLRYVNYSYATSTANQLFFGADLSTNISNNLRFSLYGEYVKGNTENDYRVNTRIVKRFNNHKKKTNYAY